MVSPIVSRAQNFRSFRFAIPILDPSTGSRTTTTARSGTQYPLSDQILSVFFAYAELLLVGARDAGVQILSTTLNGTRAQQEHRCPAPAGKICTGCDAELLKFTIKTEVLLIDATTGNGSDRIRERQQETERDEETEVLQATAAIGAGCLHAGRHEVRTHEYEKTSRRWRRCRNENVLRMDCGQTTRRPMVGVLAAEAVGVLVVVVAQRKMVQSRSLRLRVASSTSQ